MTSQNQSGDTAGKAAWRDNSVLRLLTRPLREQLARNTAPLDARLAALEKRIEEIAIESAWTAGGVDLTLRAIAGNQAEQGQTRAVRWLR